MQIKSLHIFHHHHVLLILHHHQELENCINSQSPSRITPSFDLFSTFGKLFHLSITIMLINGSIMSRDVFTERVVLRCSVKKVFLKSWQYSQENTCVDISF